MPKTITPENTEHWLALRSEDITSTESAALFDLSPYASRFELWHEKASGAGRAFVETERMRWGTRLEAAIAEGVAEERDLTIRKVNRYMRHDTVARMGSSFDFEVVNHDRGPGLLEIKNVDYLVYRNQWTEDEAPEHIEIQVQHQMEVANRDWCLIACLVAGNDLHVIERERDREMGSAICEAVNAFWASVDAGQQPEPDFERDHEFVCKMLARGGGAAVDLSGNARAAALAEAYTAMSERRGDCDRACSALKAELLWMIGDADSALLDGFKITAKTVEGGDVAYTRDPYRGFRLTKSKAKPETKKEAA